MSYRKVAIRYATSFLESSIEKNNLDRAADDMQVVFTAIKSSSLLRRFLENPVVKSEQKKSVLKKIFEKHVSPDTIKFIEFVVDKNREIALKDIAEKFLELKDEYSGIARIEIKSAFELSGEQKKMIAQRFESILNKKIVAVFLVDEKVIGGFVAKVKDTVYDASIAHQLELLRQQLLKGSLSLN
ncbi:ATP synthase F1 subunit delta [Ignavibacterium album]|uniref:ATP synthase F1 subunit delta n=1 Tax=Ignavibacterium album TaxID=591197 RepID=UPI0026F15DC4|nr:ATP synthase F1 subunit delta [Ignavibacterium album]